MEGPAIRALALARQLAGDHEVTVAAYEVEDAGDLPCVTYDRHSGAQLSGLAGRADVVIAQPQWPLAARALRRSGARLVYDLYDPDPLETLEYLAGARTGVRRLIASMSVDRVAEALRTADGLLCASAVQRDLWTGAMLADRALSPDAYAGDPGLEARMRVVPFGVPDEPPAPGPDPYRALGIDASEEVVLWNGGIWGWLDAEAAIRAVGAVRERRPGVRLVFMGASDRPAARAAADRAQSLAGDLGLVEDGGVVFNQDWVPYEDRGRWLLGAAAAISCQRDHLESRYAYRTRVLDCVWAGLPVVCTRGDALAAEVERDGLGATADAGDHEGLAGGLLEVLEAGRSSYAPRLADAAARHAWDAAAEPLRALVGELSGRDRASRLRPRRPGHLVRDSGYALARGALNLVGARGPRL